MALEVEHLTGGYSQLPVLKDVSFNVQSGELVGLIGLNGAGKSTTFKMIMNFLKPDQGTITIAGQPLDEKSLDQIGFLPEERGLYLDMTIKEQVLYFASLHGFDLKIAAADLPLWMNRLSV